jgi:hypothetical protein
MGDAQADQPLRRSSAHALSGPVQADRPAERRPQLPHVASISPRAPSRSGGTGAAALSANVRETDARTKFSVEGEQAKAARERIIESSPHFPALPHGSDVQGYQAAIQRRVQEEDRAGGRLLHAVR